MKGRYVGTMDLEATIFRDTIHNTYVGPHYLSEGRNGSTCEESSSSDENKQNTRDVVENPNPRISSSSEDENIYRNDAHQGSVLEPYQQIMNETIQFPRKPGTQYQKATSISRSETSSISKRSDVNVFSPEEKELEVPEIKQNKFIIEFAGVNISSISLFKKIVSELNVHLPASIRRKVIQKPRKLAFFVFRQFAQLTKAQKQEIIRILRLDIKTLRLEVQKCGFPKSIWKRNGYLPLTRSARLAEFLSKQNLLPRRRQSHIMST